MKKQPTDKNYIDAMIEDARRLINAEEVPCNLAAHRAAAANRTRLAIMHILTLLAHRGTIDRVARIIRARNVDKDLEDCQFHAHLSVEIVAAILSDRVSGIDDKTAMYFFSAANDDRNDFRMKEVFEKDRASGKGHTVAKFMRDWAIADIVAQIHINHGVHPTRRNRGKDDPPSACSVVATALGMGEKNVDRIWDAYKSEFESEPIP